VSGRSKLSERWKSVEEKCNRKEHCKYVQGTGIAGNIQKISDTIQNRYWLLTGKSFISETIPDRLAIADMMRFQSSYSSNPVCSAECTKTTSANDFTGAICIVAMVILHRAVVLNRSKIWPIDSTLTGRVMAQNRLLKKCRISVIHD
jgi:hypothetical protein